jgi:hypothetical protein
MLSRKLALRLRDAGVRWHPAQGDAFVVPDRDLDDRVFVLSDMVVEVLDVPGGPPVLAFNGTTEWALDSLEAGLAVWVPREDQLRTLLGTAFVGLQHEPGPPGFPSHVVTVVVGRERSRHVDVAAEDAYARALLALLAGAPG